MALQSDENDNRPWWEYPTLTVGEIADIIRLPDQDRQQVIERIGTRPVWDC